MRIKDRGGRGGRGARGGGGALLGPRRRFLAAARCLCDTSSGVLMLQSRLTAAAHYQ